MLEMSPANVVASIADRLHHIRDRIEAACARAGRSSDDVTLVAVSKTYPLPVIRAAVEAGVRHFGENRVQELIDKAGTLPGKLNGGAIQWHMIGHLQRNKAKDVVALADHVHGVDSERLAVALNQRAEAADRVVPCMLQINVSGEASKFGLEPAGVPGFLDTAATLPNLRFTGWMTLASIASDPEQVRPQFRLLRGLRDQYAGQHEAATHMTDLSMGMSGDFGVGIEEGATHVRIGRAIFGERTQF